MSLKIKKKFNAFNETLANKAKKIIEEEMPQKVNKTGFFLINNILINSNKNIMYIKMNILINRKS